MPAVRSTLHPSMQVRAPTRDPARAMRPTTRVRPTAEGAAQEHRAAAAARVKQAAAAETVEPRPSVRPARAVGWPALAQRATPRERAPRVHPRREPPEAAVPERTMRA